MQIPAMVLVMLCTNFKLWCQYLPSAGTDPFALVNFEFGTDFGQPGGSAPAPAAPPTTDPSPPAAAPAPADPPASSPATSPLPAPAQNSDTTASPPPAAAGGAADKPPAPANPVPTTLTTAPAPAPTPNIPTPPEALQYTNSLLTDFTTGVLDPTVWETEVYSISADADHGSPYGRSAEARNVVPVQGVGLELYVRSALVDGGGKVSTSEVNSKVRDVLYGTFRVGMKVPNVAGTCAAFFTYGGDSAEIDLEFLPQQATISPYPVDFVLHGPANPSNTVALTPAANVVQPAFQQVSLGVDPSANFHEYRFDWAPDAITMYFDGKAMASYTDPNAIPKTAGYLAFNHWSNGNQYWTQGPPSQDSIFTISYLHAWFNTTSSGK